MSTNNEQVNGKRRGSLQREVIYETLKGTTAHPDVDAILAMIKDKLPGIGVATVYRNLRALVDEGRVVTLDSLRRGRVGSRAFRVPALRTNKRLVYRLAAHENGGGAGVRGRGRKIDTLRAVPRLREGIAPEITTNCAEETAFRR